MAYQPPGPYPVMPMPPVAGTGAPPRPPIPTAALRSYYAILAGAGLAVVGACIGLARMGTEMQRLRSQYQNDYTSRYDPAQINTLVDFGMAAAIVVMVLEVLLWLWMAWKIKAGRHWARVLSSVFFGYAVFGQITGGLLSAATPNTSRFHFSYTNSAPSLIVGWLSVLVGLYAVVMFWKKGNADFFRPPRVLYTPYGQPYYPNQPFAAAPYPQMPMQQGYVPTQGQPQQQSDDPWSTPPQ